MTGRFRGLSGAVVFTLALLPSAAGAQQAPEGLHVWGAVGIGAGLASDPPLDGGAVLGQLVAQWGRHHHVSARLVGIFGASSSSEDAGGFGVLYGWAFRGPWGHAAAAAGLGFSGCRRDPCNGVRWGVPLQAEAALHLLSAAGVGVQLFGDLSGAPWGGVALFLQLGWMG